MRFSGINKAMVFCCALMLAAAASAVIETYEFSTPQLQERYQLLSAELRCPKCQNQNIADSNAPIAQDLRRTLHGQLEQGASDQEILDYMVARYGEFVRYRPRFGGATTLLWLFPALLLVAGVLVLALNLLNSVGTDGSFGNEGSENSVLSSISRSAVPLLEPMGIH